jgi:hypothetical protein
LYWDWTPNSHFSEANLVGYLIWANYSPPDRSPDIRAWDQIVYRPAGGGPIPRLALIPTSILQNLPCGQEYRLVVRALISAGPGRVQPSGPGILWHIPTRPCPVQARIRVTYERLTLLSAPRFPEMRDVNGDPCFLCVDRRLELKDPSGEFSVGPAFSANGNNLFIQSWGGTVFAPCARGTLCLDPGEHRLADVTLAGTAPIGLESTRQGLHQNYVDFSIDDLSSLWVGYNLVEIDQSGTTTGTQAGCSGSIELPARTVEAWTRVNETHTLTQTGGGEEATCQLDVIIEGRVSGP